MINIIIFILISIPIIISMRFHKNKDFSSNLIEIFEDDPVRLKQIGDLEEWIKSR